MHLCSECQMFAVGWWAHYIISQFYLTGDHSGVQNISLWNFSSVLNSREIAHNWQIAGTRWEEGQFGEECNSSRARTEKESVWRGLFWVIGWLYSHNVQRSVQKRAYTLLLCVSNPPKYTCLFRCLLTPGIKTRFHAVIGNTI